MEVEVEVEVEEEPSPTFPQTIAGNLVKNSFNLLKDYEPECSDYDYQYYFYVTEIIGPQVLRQAAILYPSKFYVKGGKAVDAYLDNNIGSPDWDLVLDASVDPIEFATKLAELFGGYEVKTAELNVVKFDEPRDPEISFPVFQLGIPNCSGMYMIDIVQDGKSITPEDIQFLEGIPFTNFVKMTSELDKAIKDRQEVLKESPSFSMRMDSFEQQLRKSVNNVDKTKEELNKMLQNLVKDEDHREELKEKIDDLEDYLLVLCRKVTYQSITQLLDLINANQKAALKLDRSTRRLQALRDAIRVPSRFSKSFISELCDRCREETSEVILELEEQKLSCLSILELCSE